MKTKKKTSKKATKKTAQQSWLIESDRVPTRSDSDDFDRVLVWDGKMAQLQSVSLLDHDVLWTPAPRNPNKRELAKIARAKKPGVGQ